MLNRVPNDAGLFVAVRERDPDRRLLLVHGQLLDHTVWEIPEGVAADLSVAVVDLPGHGGSSLGAHGPTIPGLARSLTTALDLLGWETCAALGHSLGARCLVEAGLREPGRFERQLLVGLPGDLGPEQRAQMRVFGELVRVRGFGSDVVNLAAQLWYSRRFAQQTPDLLGRLASRLGRNQPGIAADIFDGISKMPDLQGRLAGYGPTATILSATEDLSTPRAGMEPLAAEMEADIHELPGGHMVFEESPAQSWAAVTRWLR